MTAHHLAKRAALRVVRSPMINRALRALAHVRGHRLVLIYHRIGHPAPPRAEVVPSVPVEVFRAQLQALGEFVDLVTLDEILGNGCRPPENGDRRPAVAVTFDDDLPSHVGYALPVLRELNVRAGFFLSGRALHGLGAYWFQQLEALLIAHGAARTAALLGLPGAAPTDLGLACERDIQARRRLTQCAADVPPPDILDADDVAALARAGMTVGFHTVSHAILPDLDEDALDDAVMLGRDRLAAAAGTTVSYFAYPHGKVDGRCAAAVRRAGFVAAFTGRAGPLRRRDDPYRLARWEPGPLGTDDLLAELAIRLHLT